MTVVAHFHIHHLNYLDAHGRLIRDDLPENWRDARTLVPLFKQMLAMRVFDSKAIRLQRTGKLGTFPPAFGHEAAQIGIGAVMQRGDVFAPSYREHGVALMRGVRPRQLLLYWGGDERGSHYDADSDAARDFPLCVPISTQCLHAAGAALAFKLREKKQVAVAVCGDGGSSKADFYSALNTAGAWKLPLILCVINNGWAISVPRSAQTGAQTLAQKGIAGGLYCQQADGNDLLAVLVAMQQARERALNGEGGTVLELLTYRLADHTTVDDARRYRSEEEVKAAALLEPMIRLRHYLTAQGLWSEAEENTWLAECNAYMDAEIEACFSTARAPVSAMFDYLYADPPPELLAQRQTALALEAGHG